MSINEHVNKFNDSVRNIIKIFKDLPSKLKARIHVDAMYKKMYSGIAAQPEYVISIIGQDLIKYGDRISKGDYQFFLDKDYDIILEEMSKMHKFNYDNAVKTVQFMKDAFAIAPAEIQNEVINQVKLLLKTYANYKLNK